MATAGDYVFVHAGVRPDRPLAAQKEDDLLWIRQTFLEAPGPFEKVVVHGHTWIDARPQMLEHRIGIDTGAYATGVLTALRLDDEGRAVLQAGVAADAALPA
jgi:serine/threonine protein phosphatase 1